MKKIKASRISYKDTNRFTPLVIDYLNQSEHLKEFIQDFPSIDAIRKQIEFKQTQQIDRSLLVNVLKRQYNSISISEEVSMNLTTLLNTKTYTICTAHQPNIFTGPLYFLYKIIHAIKLANECKLTFPEFDFVPVYYMGSEDNDIDEIGTFNYNDHHYTWNTNQTGACGRMHTNELKRIVEEIANTLNEHIEDETYLLQLLRTAYNGINTLATATRIIVNDLFGKSGLLVLDGDDIEFKKSFIDVMKNELLQQNSKHLVASTISKLSEHYKEQAHPRDINLFYLKENIRERIELKNERWTVLNTLMSFTKEELIQELELHSDRFSPNVILRPLYQESLLPNIAFVGGGGELAYWMQLKSLFEANHIVFPILFLRNSVQWIRQNTSDRISKLSLNDEQLFLKKDALIKHFLSQQNVMLELLKQNQDIAASYSKIKIIAQKISSNLERSVAAHEAKQLKITERIEQKFRTQLKQQDVQNVNQIERIQQDLFPKNSLQERFDNMLSIYKILGKEMLSILLEHQNPMSGEFLILRIEE